MKRTIMSIIERLISEKAVIVPRDRLNHVYRTALNMGLRVCTGALMDNGDRVLYID